MNDKLKIVTTVSAWPDALKYQAKLLKMFCKDDYEFIAIIDSGLEPHYSNMWNRFTRKQAIEIANKYCDSVIEMPENLHENRLNLFPDTLERKGNKPSLRTADTCQFAWLQLQNSTTRKAILIDSDMFPVASFSFNDLTKDKNIGAVKQLRGNNDGQIEYLWNGIIAANFELLPAAYELSFDAGFHEGFYTDTGGASYAWVQKNIDKINWIDYKSSLNWDTKEIRTSLYPKLKNFIVHDDRNLNEKIYSEIYADIFFHFRGGGNWNMEPRKIVFERHKKVFESFCEILNEDLFYTEPKRNYSLQSLLIEFYYYSKWKLKRFFK